MSVSSSKLKPNLDCYEGEWRRPVNDLRKQHVAGGHKSIHDRATAAAAGFSSGAPVHGTVHFSQLITPLLVKIYGQAWFERGTISVIFRNIVSHLQPVKAFIEKPRRQQPEQVRVWMEHLDGKLVFEGTASLGIDRGETMVDKQLKRVKPIRGNLVFVPQKVGTITLETEHAKLEWGTNIGELFPFTPEEKLRIITEWHPWFGTGTEDVCSASSSPWGGRPILPPEALNQIMLYTSPKSKWPPEPHNNLLPRGITPIGLFGGCDIKMHNGPVFLGQTYGMSRELVAKGETPKTEFRYLDSNHHARLC